MDDRDQFLSLLKPVRRQLVIEIIIKEGQLLLCLIGALSFFLLLLGQLFVIPFLLRYLLIGTVFILVFVMYRIWIARPSWHDAAVVFNQYVQDDRVVTALSFLHEEGIMQKLQLADSIHYMKKAQAAVLKRKKALMNRKSLSIGMVLWSATILLFFFPSEKIELAKKKETAIKIVKEAEKKLEQKIKAEKDPEIKKVLVEAKKEIGQKADPEEALQELKKHEKELQLKELKAKEKQQQLADWKQELQKTGLSQLATALETKEIAKVEEELKKLNKDFLKLTDEQKQALSKWSQQQGQLTDEQLEQLKKQLAEALQSEEFMKQLAATQQNLNSVSQSMQQQMAANGIPSTQLAQSSSPSNQTNQNPSQNQGSQTNSNNPNGQNQGNQPGNSTSGNSGNGKGNGSGNGNGSGKGNGSGSGSGSGGGSGSGSGSGSGAGTGMGSRDFLTVPEYLKGKGQTEVDSGPLGQGSPNEQTAGTGPVINGQLRPYQEVFSQYQNSYRESTERLRLPSELEEIVKNYFTNLDPNKE